MDELSILYTPILSIFLYYTAYIPILLLLPIDPPRKNVQKGGGRISLNISLD